MELMLVALVGTLNVMCFLIGAKVGQKVSRDETIELPNLNPMKAIREMQDKREAERVQDKIETIMQNIDSYDGTSAGQRDVRG
jgi:uncharacterized protein YneF (UPF0154 family)